MKVVIVSLILALVVGCQKEEPAPTLIVLNGEPITAKMLKDQVLVQARLSELKGKPVGEEQLPQWGNENAVPVMRALLSSTLIKQELAKKNITPSADETCEIVKGYCEQFKLKAGCVDELVKAFGEPADPFRDLLEREVAVLTYQRKYWEPEITDLMVRQYLTFSSNRVTQAAEIDKKARARAEEAHARLKKGEKWMDVAKAYSEDKLLNPQNEKYMSEWLSVGPTAVGIQPLARVLPAMKVGDFTEPLDTRDGMLIVRLNGMNGNLYRLSRILFRMANPVNIPRSAEDARRQLEESRLMDNRQQSLNVLWNSAKREYPIGTNFTYQIWQKHDQHDEK